MKEGWEEKRLGDVCDFDKNLNGKKNLPYIGLENIESNTGRFIGTLDPCQVKSSTFNFNEKHLLYGRLRPYLNKVFIPNFEGHCSTEIFPIIVNDSLLREYLFYWFTSEKTVEMINSTCTGARMPRANMKEVLNFEIPIPPLSEQKEIVVKLDEAFAAIDVAKTNIKKNIGNARELFQSRLNEIFSRQGDGWEEKKLGDVCENLDSKRVPITKNKRKSGNIPYYGASGIVDYVEDYIFDENLLLVSEDGANLLARTYPIAFSISGKSWVNNHAHVLRFENVASQTFIEYYLNSIKLDDYVSGMAQPKLNQKMLNSISVPYPIVEIQEQIVSQLDLLEKNIEGTVEKYNQKLTNLEELKKSLLQKAFAGELT